MEITSNYIISLLRDNPSVPIFLTLGIGFWIGGMRIGSFWQFHTYLRRNSHGAVDLKMT